MAALNESNVERKLQGVSVTQDSIQSLSLWVIHHKAHHEKIVGIWLRVLKKSNTKHRLTMFYLCNDIVQTCKRKHAVVYKDAFKEILKEAVVHVRDSSIRPNIERIFKIWSERNVYDATFTEELTDIISNSTSRSVISRLLAEFQPEKALEKIMSFKALEIENETRKVAISTLRLDASSIEAIRQLKDRDKGREYSQQFEDGCVKLEEFLVHSEAETKQRTLLIELLEQSELFYDAQYSEAKIVANAYKNFGTRVSNLKKRLDEFMKTLPSPVPTPELDAPSPEQSPVYPPTTDNTEQIDMEMSDSDNDAPALVETHSGSGDGGSCRRPETTTTTKAYPKPIASVTEIRMRYKSRKRKSTNQSSSNDFKSLEESCSESSFRKSKKSNKADPETDRWQSAFKESKPSPNTSDTEPDAVNLISVVSQSVGRVSSMEIYNDRDEGEGTPVKDELSSTPVQDEEEAEEGEEEETEATATATAEQPNPIEFLTQLINQSKNTGGGGTGPGSGSNSTSSNFLQNLVSGVNVAQYGNGEAEKTEEPEMETPATWAAWKAAQNPPPPPESPSGALQTEYGQANLPPQPVPPPQQLQYGQSPLPPPPPPPPPPHQQSSFDLNPPQQPPYGSNHPPMMVPPPFPPNMHNVASQLPQPQLPPQPVPAPNIAPPPPMMSHMPPHLPPPSHIIPMPPPNVPSWPHPHSVGQMPPPSALPTSTNNMSPQVSVGYNMPMSQPPPPPPSIQQPLQPPPSLQSPPAQTLLSTLRPRANSNLTEVQVMDDNQSPEGGCMTSSPNIPLVGGGRPVRPTFPPSPGIMHGPRPPPDSHSPATPPAAIRHPVSDDQKEFIEKLKRKSSITSPTAVPVGMGATLNFLMEKTMSNSKNLRTLTEVKPEESNSSADQATPQTNATGDTEQLEAALSEASSKASSKSSSKSSADTVTEAASNNANANDENESTASDSPEQKPVQRIQSVASRVTRIETTADNMCFDKYNSSNYDRRVDAYTENPYQRDMHREHYGGDRYGGGGERYGYDRPPRDYYHQRDPYRSGPGKPRGPNQSYDRRPDYYPRY